MARREILLKWWLRALAVVLFSALPAVFLPFTWMAAVHDRLGLGNFPETPMISYLARSVSLLYASYGSVLWFCSRDVRRYRELIQFQGWLAIVFGGIMMGIDLLAAMPLAWLLCEAVAITFIGGVMLALTRPRQPDLVRAGETARSIDVSGNGQKN